MFQKHHKEFLFDHGRGIVEREQVRDGIGIISGCLKLNGSF